MIVRKTDIPIIEIDLYRDHYNMVCEYTEFNRLMMDHLTHISYPDKSKWSDWYPARFSVHPDYYDSNKIIPAPWELKVRESQFGTEFAIYFDGSEPPLHLESLGWRKATESARWYTLSVISKKSVLPQGALVRMLLTGELP